MIEISNINHFRSNLISNNHKIILSLLNNIMFDRLYKSQFTIPTLVTIKTVMNLAIEVLICQKTVLD